MRLTGSTDGRAAFMRNPRDFMLALPDDGKLFIRAIGYNQAPHDAAFSLGKVSEVRARVLALCPAPAPSKRPPAKKE
jgi:hypothetical protein